MHRVPGNREPRAGDIVLSQIRQRFLDVGLMPVGSAPEEFAAFMQRDLAFYTKLIRGAGIEPQ